MPETITAAEANRAFSRLLREVRDDGRSFVVIANGRPVARVVPVEAQHDDRRRARATLRARLAA